MRLLLLLLALTASTLPTPAAAQSLDGTWLLFDTAEDPKLARLTAEGGRLPQEEIDAHKRIVLQGDQATVHAGEAAISMTVTPTAASWGVDAQVSALDGSSAPITFLRFELQSDDAGTLTSYAGQTPLEQFAILRVRADG